jgi:DNA-binding CsgD family transcriptional regulator
MLVGRELERARIDALMSAVRGGRGGALIVRGEPGIGKTALLAYAEEQAESMRVLHARGVEAEAELAFAGLHELLRPLLGLVEELPERQAAALRGALALGPAVNARLLIAAGALSLLAVAADERPLLCLVDDAHWLDGESAEALVFVARRLEADPVLLVFGAREGEPRAFEPAGLDVLVLGGLAREEAALLLRDRGLPEGVVADLYRTSAGNPLALLELPGALSEGQRAGLEPLADPLPVTKAVQAAFARRIERLPAETQTALLVAAAEPSFELRPVAGACAGMGVAVTALEAAETVSLVTLERGQVLFRHPLVRAAAYHGPPAAERRAAHRALAQAFEGAGGAARRAWHLAAAAVGPDDEVAGALEAVGDEALSRGGLAAAAAAYERAAMLTIDGEARAKRMYRAAWYAYSSFAAASRSVFAVLEQVLIETGDEDLRFELQVLRGQMLYQRDPLVAYRLLLEEADRFEGDAPERAALLATIASFDALRAADALHALEAAERAQALHHRAASPADPFVAVATGAALLLNGRVNEAVPFFSAIDEHARQSDEAFEGDLKDVMQGFVERVILALEVLFAIGDLDGAATHTAVPVAWARRNGSSVGLAWAAGYAGRVDLLAGRWAAARAALAEADQHARETHLMRPQWIASAALAELAAAQGAEEECRRWETAAAAAAAAWAGASSFGLLDGCAAGLLALGYGRLDEAASLYADQLLPALGPLKLYPGVADAAESFVRAGRAELAEPLLSAFLSQARQAGWPWALARAAHLEAISARPDDAEARFEEALRWHEHARQPFPHARTQLAHGEWLRRSGRRIDARPQLRAALQTFEQLAAAPWADRAGAELRATGERVRRRAEARTSQLTPQELQVALTVAAGATNKEAAGQLYLSPKTIEKHLGSAYRKLGVSSRAELGAFFATAQNAAPLLTQA